MTSARHGAGYNLFFHAGIFDEYMDAPRRTRTASLPLVSDRFGMVPPRRRVRHSIPDSHPFPSHTYHRHLDRAEGNLLRKPLSASASASTPPHLQTSNQPQPNPKKKGAQPPMQSAKHPNSIYINTNTKKKKKKKTQASQLSKLSRPQ